jgi:hypothetical protein
MVWVCSFCSGENIDARTRCGLCDSDKPKGASAPALSSSAPKSNPPPAASRPGAKPVAAQPSVVPAPAASGSGSKKKIDENLVTELMMMGYSESHVRHAISIVNFFLRCLRFC